MTSPSPSEFDLKPLVRQLGHLIDVTRIIDRNGEDGVFSAQAGAEICYVFDTNVIQMFLEPYRNPHYAEVFHNEIWNASSDRNKEINTEACLLAAEYLLSGGLPGQKDRRWYMSRAHHAETGAQLEHLARSIKQTAERLRRDPKYRTFAEQQLQELNTTLQIEPDRDREQILLLDAQMGASEGTLDDLRKMSAEEFRERAVGIRSRAACRILANDRILEPADQMHRLQDKEVAGGLRILEAEFPITDADRRAISEEADGWHVELSTVLVNRGHGGRTREAISADCQTLALMSWASRHSGNSHRRFVFVTGDRALLEAYKLRHVTESDHRPFLLRPTNHFAPIFNPRSANSMLPKPRRAFRRLQEALENAMVALNLALLSDDNADRRLRARDHFSASTEHNIEAVTGILVDYFPAFRDPAWLTAQSELLEALVAELQPIELLMLEAYPLFIAARLDAERRKFEDQAADQTVGKALADRVEHRLAAASGAGFQFALPMMELAVSEQVRELIARKGMRAERALVATRISFSHEPGRYLDYTQEIEALKSATPNQLPKIVRSFSNKAFTLATMLAFSLETWKDAARYASLAASASEHRVKRTGNGDNSDWDDHYEHLYIEALALRFRLAGTSPESNYNEPWTEWVNSAHDILVRCEKHHSAHGQISRQIRASSEMASLHVSLCEWYAFGDPMALNIFPETDTELLHSFGVVVKKLKVCDELYETALENSKSDDLRSNNASSAVLNRVVKQFRFNVFAARLVAERLSVRWPAIAEKVSELVEILPDLREVPWDNKPPVAAAYLAATTRDIAALKKIDTSSLSLALDVAVIVGLRNMATEWTP
jgi:hypothetical protein